MTVLPLVVDGGPRDHGGMKIEIVVFDGFDEMDAIAPYEVLRTAAELGAPIDAELVGAHGAGTVTASHGARIAVERGPSEAPDVMLVPGGGWFHGAGVRAEIERGVLTRALVAAHEGGSIVASVCTGAMLLAATGLVEGRPATTHHAAIEDLRAAGAQIVDGARFVDDGDVLTAGGVTSGLDLALHLVEKVAGASIADQVARDIEYERRETAV
jgi:transcriptional regulator GlxA family with amidase domain